MTKITKHAKVATPSPAQERKEMNVQEIIKLTCGFLKHVPRSLWPTREQWSAADRERERYLASLWEKPVKK